MRRFPFGPGATTVINPLGEFDGFDPIVALVKVFNLFGKSLMRFAAFVGGQVFPVIPHAETDTFVGIFRATQQLAIQ